VILFVDENEFEYKTFTSPHLLENEEVVTQVRKRKE
jgi:hypothetical protein